MTAAGGTVLAGRTAVITGGASGLGEATARRFAAEGARVVIADLAEGRAREVAASIDPAGRLARGIGCDITDPDSCDRMVAEAEAFFGAPVGIFHANAGAAFSGAFTDAEPERIRMAVAVNVTGAAFSAQAAVRSMQRGNGGCLLFTSSLQGLLARSYRSLYTATKHAVTGLVKSLAIELGPMGIRVNALAPTGIDTPLLREQLARTTDDVDAAVLRIAGGLPLRRMPTPGDFADAAVFLASDQARCITGHTLVIDCGASAGLSGTQPPGAQTPGAGRGKPDA